METYNFPEHVEIDPVDHERAIEVLESLGCKPIITRNKGPLGVDSIVGIEHPSDINFSTVDSERCLAVCRGGRVVIRLFQFYF